MIDAAFAAITPNIDNLAIGSILLSLAPLGRQPIKSTVYIGLRVTLCKIVAADPVFLTGWYLAGKIRLLAAHSLRAARHATLLSMRCLIMHERLDIPA